MKKINIILAILIALIGSFYGYYLTTQPLDLTPLTTGKTEKDYWIATQKHHVNVTKEIRDLKLSACIMLQYDINKQGKFENPVVLGHVAGDLIKEELIASMKKWQWEPAASNPQRKPIRWVRYFGTGDNESNIREKCMSAHIIG